MFIDLYGIYLLVFFCVFSIQIPAAAPSRPAEKKKRKTWFLEALGSLGLKLS